jgi:hypothetical protein
VKLKITALPDDKPVKVAIELPATVHRDLAAYADILSRESGQSISDPARLIAPMLARFMATDRAFSRQRRRTEVAASSIEKRDRH